MLKDDLHTNQQIQTIQRDFTLIPTSVICRINGTIGNAHD